MRDGTVPKALFKYLPYYDDDKEDFFDNLLLRITPPGEFNDPFDGLLSKASYDYFLKNGPFKTEEEREEVIRKFNYNWEQGDTPTGFENWGVVCFTEQNLWEKQMFDVRATKKQFTTSDGVELSYLEAGSGQPLIMIPGWSQTAKQWHNQINHFADSHRVLALDLRGHGESAKPDFGYHVYRFSKDLCDMIVELGLGDMVLMGHSMGCSVIWGYYDLYGAHGIAKIVFVDEPPSLSDNPTLNDDTRPLAGAIFNPEATFATAIALANDESGEVTADLVTGMFTESCPRDIVEKTITLNKQFPRDRAAELLLDHVHNDWRDVVKRINVPALCIGGKASQVPWSSVVWQSEQMSRGECEIFEAEDGGSHFMFMENPDKFNARVAMFLS